MTEERAWQFNYWRWRRAWLFLWAIRLVILLPALVLAVFELLGEVAVRGLDYLERIVFAASQIEKYRRIGPRMFDYSVARIGQRPADPTHS